MSKYLVTGGNGLVGRAVCKELLSQGHQVIAMVRDKNKGTDLADIGIKLIEQDITSKVAYRGDIDFIVHAAAPTDGCFFMTNPVEVEKAIVIGAINILEFAREKKAAIVMLSSMEVYGESLTDQLLTEDKSFFIETMSVRSSYPISKRMMETLSYSYFDEYGVNVRTVRLAQVFGSELLPTDRRAPVAFMRLGMKGEDIRIATDGATKHAYIYIDDAVTGILVALNEGSAGEVYNISDENLYTSIYDLAKTIARVCDKGSRVLINAGDKTRFPSTRKLNVCSEKLRSLGWSPPHRSIEEIFGWYVESMVKSL